MLFEPSAFVEMSHPKMDVKGQITYAVWFEGYIKNMGNTEAKNISLSELGVTPDGSDSQRVGSQRKPPLSLG